MAPDFAVHSLSKDVEIILHTCIRSVGANGRLVGQWFPYLVLLQHQIMLLELRTTVFCNLLQIENIA